MAPRAFGALFAFVAALLFTASLAGAIAPNDLPVWWDGHPTVESAAGSKTLDRKAIHVGLLGASGCNLGNTVVCNSLDTGALLKAIGIAELAVLGVLTLTTFALLVSIWRIGERRKRLGRVVVIEVLIAAAIAGAFFALGPDIQSGTATVSVPIGIGLYLFGGGVTAALFAGLLAHIVEREPLRLKTSKRIPVAEPETAFDVRELAQPRRPSQPVIPPTPTPLARPQAHVPIARVPTPLPPTGPHLPIDMPVAPSQLDHAPQLRPLYEMPSLGVAPMPMPMPMPMPVPAPAPTLAPSPTPTAERPPTPTPRPTQPEASPAPPPAQLAGAEPTPNPPARPARTKAASLPPMRQVAPPSRHGNAAMSKQPTIAHAVPPMPPIASVRAETELEPSTTVEIDAEAKARWQAEQARKAATSSAPPPDPIHIRPTATYSAQADATLLEADTVPSRPSSRQPAQQPTGSHVAPIGELARATEPHDVVTFGGQATEAMNAIEPAPGLPGPAATPAVTVDTAEFDRTLETAEPAPTRHPVSALKLQPISVPKTIAPKPIPNVLAPSPQQRPRPESDRFSPRAARASQAPAMANAEPTKSQNVPMSTAPASLPPPMGALASAGPTPACPQCEAPMAWVEEHLRFYCKQCRMYF